MSDLESIFASMTLAELARLGDKSPSQIAAYALSASRSSSPSQTNGSRAPARPTTGGARQRDTASPSGRDDFDAAILAALREAGGPVRSVDIEAKVGGTPVQRRTALRRLVAAKKIKRAGVARATTYEAR